jgi:hypothetical protein
MQLENLLALSTAHLTQEALENIENLAPSYPNEYGAFVYVPKGATWPEHDEDLNAIFYFARSHNIAWLKFDRDAPELKEFKTYDW